MPEYERRRSRSPQSSSRKHSTNYRESRHSHSHRKRSRSPRERANVVPLPLNARQLSKYDLPIFRAMFGLYLDLQKEIDIDTLSNEEIKGRWKSFIGKWNRGELAEGWYDPATKIKADNSAIATERTAMKYGHETVDSREYSEARDSNEMVDKKGDQDKGNDDEEDDDDDEYGPPPPPAGQTRAGPLVPRLEDLQHRNELSLEEQEARLDDLRYERKMDRKSQREALDELVPRAQAGTRERQLEKKREAASSNRAFREAKSPGAEEVGEKDLMGDDQDGVKGYIKANLKKKTEREIRKEEILRAREAEREERLKIARNKEDKTMEMLKAIARERFGAN